MADRLAGRLAWALGGKSKRAGDVLAALGGRLLSASPVHRVRLSRQQVAAAGRQLEAMSYRKVLARGFSVTRGRGGAILRSVADAKEGQWIDTELADGHIDSQVARQGEPSHLKQQPTAEPRLFE